MPSYRPYCPYTTGPPGGDYQGPDIALARDLVKASGTQGMKVTVTDIVGDYNPPFDAYFAHVLRTIRYRVTRPLVPVSNMVDWWITAERVGNYQGGSQTVGPLLSQLWIH
jgi:hypothetical protein